MKSLQITLLILLGFVPFAGAQFTRGDAIKATTTVHGDGSRSTLVVDPETRTGTEMIYSTSGKVSGKIIYPLDEQNQPLGAISYDPRGVIVAKSNYKRDEAGRIGEETITNAAGQFLRRRVYSYVIENNKSRIIRVDEYDANGVMIVPPRAAKADKKKSK